MKIKGLKKAIGEYKRANEGGCYSPRYGRLMFDKSTGEIWCDVFYDLGHNEYKVYHDPNIINLEHAMVEFNSNWNDPVPITMQTVKAFCAEHYGIS